MTRLLPLLLVLAACPTSGEPSSSDEPDASVGGPRIACGLHSERMPCEMDRSCIWATGDDGSEWCLPKPPDCRFEPCEAGTTCAAQAEACLPGCTGPDCCAAVFACLHVDAGVVDSEDGERDSAGGTRGL